MIRTLTSGKRRLRQACKWSDGG